MTDHTLYLGLGSNLGDKEHNIREAIRRIEELIGTVECQSALYVTEPWGFQSPHLFVNAAVRCRTQLSPREVLRRTQQIERAMGRRHKGRTADGTPRVYHDRTIDIDLLLYDQLTIDEPDLQIPHPLMHQRPFVMQPLSEVMD
ncbi:MAG: 2-amino-4-hydroxy-6-hydroxymethyldihydropteridine diphosphokinase [Prevotella sp.]|nr:2-amino-4-hydroxy-6-hydroxymethyldihydropteridine diphosphokinase [Prevotella sp.]